MKDIKTSLKTENKNWLSIEKNTKYRKIKIPHKKKAFNFFRASTKNWFLGKYKKF